MTAEPVVSGGKPAATYTPAALAQDVGMSEKALRKLAIELNACSVFGQTMRFFDRDVEAIKGFLASTNGTIYFIRADLYVKIGFTKRPEMRLSAIRRNLPMRIQVVYAEHGTLKDEARYHRQFAEQHLHHEWFRFEGALADFLLERIR